MPVFFICRTVEHGEQVLQGLQVALKDIASQLLEIERISAEAEMKVGSDNFVLQWVKTFVTMSHHPNDNEEYDESSEESYSGDSSRSTDFTENLHSSDEEDDLEEDYLAPEQPVRRRAQSAELLLPKKRIPHEDPQDYAPDRWPPILDFVFVFSSFIAAVVAAYFTIF